MRPDFRFDIIFFLLCVVLFLSFNFPTIQIHYSLYTTVWLPPPKRRSYSRYMKNTFRNLGQQMVCSQVSQIARARSPSILANIYTPSPSPTHCLRGMRLCSDFSTEKGMEGVQQLFQKVYELSDTDARGGRMAERVGRENVHTKLTWEVKEEIEKIRSDRIMGRGYSIWSWRRRTR